MTDKPRSPSTSSSIEPDEAAFFSATPPPAASEEKHFLTPNPELDRPGNNRLAGLGGSAPLFVQGITGVKDGYENAMRVTAMSGNALYETDVERRISALNEALNFMETVKDDPYAAEAIAAQKGMVLGSIAGALMARRQGNPVQNRKDAIDYYQRAMQHFIAQEDHQNVIKTKYNLADAYAAGISSDDRSDGKLALSYLRETIAEASSAESPLVGRAARINFASLARRFEEGAGGASVIEEAIGYLEEVIAEVSKGDDPALWSSAMNSLGALYTDRQGGDDRSNLQRAIRCFEQSLEARPKDKVPDLWDATTRNLLAVKRLYAQKFEASQVDESLQNYLAERDRAIAEYTARGKLLLAADEKLGLARDLISAPDGKNDFKRAQSLIESALETFRERNAISEMVRALQLLHYAELHLEEMESAAFHGWYALYLSEQLEEGGVELERVREISQSLKGLDARVALIYLAAGETAAAIDALEYGRARFLRSALRLQSTELTQRAAIGRARSKVIALDRELATDNNAPRDRVEAFIEARKELAALERELPPSSPLPENAFGRTWHVVERLMTTYRAIVLPIFDGKRSAIAVLALKGDELRASVVFAECDIRPILDRWRMVNWGDAAARKATIDVTMTELWDAFGLRVVQGLVRREVPFGSRVAIVPQGDFGQLPLALARDAERGHTLCDMFEFSFAPSLMALDRPTSEPQPPTLAAISNPTGDLKFAPIEALTSAKMFSNDDSSAYLYGAECTKFDVLAALRARSHWLFSAHGEFDRSDARRSGLRLSNGERLTLDDMLTASDIQAPRLVILSACDTGLHAVERAADEFVGLPVGFLQLGAGAVLATLWPVSDASTALFVSAFMTSHISGGNRPAYALQDGQHWLREATASKIRNAIATLIGDEIPPDTRADLEAFDRMLARMDPSARVFEHPYYWGGFVLYGA